MINVCYFFNNFINLQQNSLENSLVKIFQRIIFRLNISVVFTLSLIFLLLRPVN